MGTEGAGHDRDVDEEFARIVAGWDDVATTSGSATLPPPVRMPAGPDDGPPTDDPESAAAGDDDLTGPRGRGGDVAGAHPPGAHPPGGDALERDASGVEPPSGDLRGGDDAFGGDASIPEAPAVDPPGGGPRGADDTVAGDAQRADAPPADRPEADDAVGAGATAYEVSETKDQAWRGYLPDEPDEHFEPPEPQLPPAHDATYWLAVLGLVAGPLLVLWAVVLSGDPDPGWLILAGLLLTIGGFGLLIMRGSGERDPGDDGSRV